MCVTQQMYLGPKMTKKHLDFQTTSVADRIVPRADNSRELEQVQQPALVATLDQRHHLASPASARNRGGAMASGNKALP